MPTIPSRPDILKRPTKLDLNEIENYMLWPHDEAARCEARLAAIAEAEAENFKSFVSQRDFASFKLNDLTTMVDLLRQTQPLRDIRMKAYPRFLKGQCAGWILFQSLGRQNLTPKMAGLQRIKKELSRRMIDDDIKFSMSAIEKLWLEFKCVSHLWAAHGALALKAAPQSYPFPCKRGDLLALLALAETLRREGIAKRGPQARMPVLDADECYVFPPEVKIPIVPIAWRLEDVPGATVTSQDVNVSRPSKE